MRARTIVRRRLGGNFTTITVAPPCCRFGVSEEAWGCAWQFLHTKEGGCGSRWSRRGALWWTDDPPARSAYGARSAGCLSTSRMRRVHIPLRYPASLQRPCLARTVRTDNTQPVHTQELPSTRNVSTTSESPRVVFSGIQPTGIPHVRRPCLIRRDYAHATLTTVSARKLFWRACELGQVTIYRRARRQALFLRCRLACPHTAAGSQDPLGSPEDYDGSHTCVWHRRPKSRRFPSGRGDCSSHVIY